MTHYNKLHLITEILIFQLLFGIGLYFIGNARIMLLINILIAALLIIYLFVFKKSQSEFKIFKRRKKPIQRKHNSFDDENKVDHLEVLSEMEKYK